MRRGAPQGRGGYTKPSKSLSLQPDAVYCFHIGYLHPAAELPALCRRGNDSGYACDYCNGNGSQRE